MMPLPWKVWLVGLAAIVYMAAMIACGPQIIDWIAGT